MARPPKDEAPNPVHIVSSDVAIGSSGGGTTTVAGPLGRGADAASISTALSTEDVALLTALLTQSNFDSKIGSLTEVAPATDTASSGLNGRLQRIAQRLTSLIAQIPAALGQQTRAASLSVTVASDQTGANAQQIQGSAADGAVPAGNPMLVAGFDGTNVQYLLTETSGLQRAALYSNGGVAFSLATPSDTFTNSGNALSVNAYQMLYDSAAANWERRRVINITTPLNAVNTNAELTIVTPTAGKKFRLMGGWLVGSIAGNYVLRDNTAGTTILVVPSGAGGSGVYFNLGQGILSAAANNVLTAQGPLTSTFSGFVFGTEE